MKVLHYCEKIYGSFKITRDTTNHRFVLSNEEEIICNDILEWWHFTDDNEFIYILNDESLIHLSLKTLSSKVIINADEFNKSNQKGSLLLERLEQSDLSSQNRFFIGRSNILYIYRDIISHSWSLNIASPMSNFKPVRRSALEYYLFEIDDTLFGAFVSDIMFSVIEFKSFCIKKLLTISFKTEMPFLSVDLRLGDNIYTLTKEDVVISDDFMKSAIPSKLITKRNGDGEIIFKIYNDERLLTSYFIGKDF